MDLDQLDANEAVRSGSTPRNGVCNNEISPLALLEISSYSVLTNYKVPSLFKNAIIRALQSSEILGYIKVTAHTWTIFFPKNRIFFIF